jgi:hypothetical protein
MGIKNLNRYLLKNCGSNAICLTHISEFRNRTIVVDTSIYMYKYLEDDKLLENFQKLINTFKNYQIIPIFVFDGKAPIEKRKLLEQRHQNKVDAETEYNKISNNISSNVIQVNDVIRCRLNQLKKQFLRICDTDIAKLQKLMKDNNVEVIVAKGEADELCASYMMNKKCWGVLSDDMDFFVYGCSRVLRELSLYDDSVMLYKMSEILYDLKMPLKSFRDILVISGTDYNLVSPDENICLRETLKWYKWYKVYCKNHRSEYQLRSPLGFYEWLLVNTKYIKNVDELRKVHCMFSADKIIPLMFTHPEICG